MYLILAVALLIIPNSLMVFVLTFFLKDVDGPWDLFKRIRIMIGYEYNQFGALEVIPTTFLGGLFNCFWCLATWVSIFCSAAAVLSFQLPWWAFFWIWIPAIAIAGSMYLKMDI